MNPNNSELGPVARGENLPQPDEGERQETAEAAPATAEKDTSVTRSPIISLPQDLPDAPVPTIPADDGSQPAIPTDVHDDHLDVKPWVERTKEVVSHTKDDPFMQKRELSKVKAEYIKSRFNKIIKAEDSA